MGWILNEVDGVIVGPAVGLRLGERPGEASRHAAAPPACWEFDICPRARCVDHDGRNIATRKFTSARCSGCSIKQ
jgi:hypothetical protein